MTKKIILSAMVSLVALLSIAYGGLMIFVVFAESGSILMFLFGVLSALFGAVILYQLASVLARHKPASVTIVDYTGRAFTVSYTLLSFDSGTISGFEWVSILLVVALVFTMVKSFHGLNKLMEKY